MGLFEKKNNRMDKGNKKIALLTFWKNSNHGSALQAFALYNFIYNQGFNAEYLLYDSHKAIGIKSFFYRRIKSIVHTFELRKHKGLLKEDKRSNQYDGSNLIMQFWDQIPHSNVIYNKKTCRLSLDIYDTFIVGGDQLWNPYITLDNHVYLLDFVDDPSCKNSYSPSFGISHLSKSHLKTLQHYLLSFSNIGCRDAINGKFLSEHINKEVVHTVDPVLLLSEDEWRQIMKPLSLPARYLLCYQLGDSSVLSKAASELAGKMRIPVLYLTNSSNPFCVSNISPGNFIYLIANADYVITDSYHGILFSMIFGKPFSPFYKRGYRESVSDNWRIFDLCLFFGFHVGEEIRVDSDSRCFINNCISNSKKYLQSILYHG